MSFFPLGSNSNKESNKSIPNAAPNTSISVIQILTIQEHPEKITCPSCHTDCQLGPAGVAGLLADYGVSGISDSQLDGAYCTGCKSRESSAVARCFDCSNFLCANCVMAHQVRFPLLRSISVKVMDLVLKPLQVETLLSYSKFVEKVYKWKSLEVVSALKKTKMFR